jgi:four helix bundle protein
MKDSIVKNKSYAFAVNIVRLARELRQQREYELSKQVLRSGTSIGANIEEALAGISRRDFTAKMSIA